MKITVNGTVQECGAPSILSLVESMGLPVRAVLVEHNGEALRREEWAAHALVEGDRIEIIRIVAGG